MHYLFLTLKGLAMGIANVVPGVSGATLAVIFRVYDHLIEAINQLFTEPKKSLQFLIPLGLGMVIGILALGSLLDYFILRFSLQAGALIAGLMAGSMPFIHGLATSQSGKKPHFYVIAAIAAIIIIVLSLFVPTPELYVAEEINFGLVAILFIAGILGAAAMIIPGVSGAMVLILLGVFPLVMHTISLIREYLMTPFDFGLLSPILMVVVPIGLGVVIGILIMSRLIAVLLKKFHSATYFAILGMILGTIFAIFGDDATYQSHDAITLGLIIAAVLIFAVGMVVSLKLGKRQ